MDQIILGDLNSTEQTIDFGGSLDWQRNDASPVLFKGAGKYTFKNFDARLFGGDSLFELDLLKGSKLPSSFVLEIYLENIVAGMAEDDSGIPDFHTRPRFFNSNFWGGFTKLSVKNVQYKGLAGFKIQGGRVDAPRDGKIVHVNGLDIYDPNPDIYLNGRVLTPADIDFEKYPQLVGELEPIRKFAALERWNDAKRGGQYSRHAINLRYFFGLIEEIEDVLVENFTINTLQRFPGDKVEQLKRIYADLFNTMIAADPSTIVRDETGAVVKAGVTVRNGAIFGHYTPEQKNSGTHCITDQVNVTKKLDLPGSLQNGGYRDASQGTLFHRILSVEAMNAAFQSAGQTTDGSIPGFPAEDQGNYFTECAAVSAPEFYGLKDEEGKPVVSPYNSRGFGNYPSGSTLSTEFSRCKSLYFNTRRWPGITNFVIDNKTVKNGADDPTGRAPMTGPRANQNIFLPESEVPRIRKEWVEEWRQYLPKELGDKMPFADVVVDPVEPDEPIHIGDPGNGLVHYDNFEEEGALDRYVLSINEGNSSLRTEKIGEDQDDVIRARINILDMDPTNPNEFGRAEIVFDGTGEVDRIHETGEDRAYSIAFSVPANFKAAHFGAIFAQLHAEYFDGGINPFVVAHISEEANIVIGFRGDPREPADLKADFEALGSRDYLSRGSVILGALKPGTTQILDLWIRSGENGRIVARLHDADDGGELALVAWDEWVGYGTTGGYLKSGYYAPLAKLERLQAAQNSGEKYRSIFLHELLISEERIDWDAFKPPIDCEKLVADYQALQEIADICSKELGEVKLELAQAKSKIENLEAENSALKSVADAQAEEISQLKDKLGDAINENIAIKEKGKAIAGSLRSLASDLE